MQSKSEEATCLDMEKNFEKYRNDLDQDFIKSYVFKLSQTVESNNKLASQLNCQESCLVGELKTNREYLNKNLERFLRIIEIDKRVLMNDYGTRHRSMLYMFIILFLLAFLIVNKLL